MNPSALFEEIRQRVAASPELVDEVNGIYQFDVSGDAGGSWTIDLKNAPGEVRAGACPEADCVITVGSDTFVGIFSGELDPQTAFMMGRIKVAGNFMLATKLRVLLA